MTFISTLGAKTQRDRDLLLRLGAMSCLTTARRWSHDVLQSVSSFASFPLTSSQSTYVTDTQTHHALQPHKHTTPRTTAPTSQPHKHTTPRTTARTTALVNLTV